MVVSTKGRYALKVLADLAEQSKEGFVPLHEIADRQQISEKYLESILKVLVNNRILAGLRGKGGGYRLAIPPEELTVGRVLRLTENSLAAVECLSSNAEACPKSGSCRTLPVWRELDRRINDYLDSVTIADLLEPADGNREMGAEG